jgi:DNA repair exonuclease SbcCD ATPase subunit
MAIRELISRTGKWFSARKESLYEPLRETPVSDRTDNSSGIISRRGEPVDRIETLQVIQRSFEQLVEKLGGINENIDRQIKQNEELIQRMAEFPQLLQNFPESLKNQKAVIDAMIEQLKVQALKNQQFTEAVEKIPVAAEKQTNAISDMAVQLAASAEVDAQLAAGFAKFNSITDKLKDNVEGQTDSIIQLSRTFSASDRYLKYILNTQHKRFMWVFIAALSVCAFAIAVLLIVIFLLK